MHKQKKIFFWANNKNANAGEGILAENFIELLKKREKNYLFKNINNFQFSQSFFYNYITPYLGILKIWYLHLRNYKVCYINYLPIWNFIIFLFLPKKTILGPITGTKSKKNIFYFFLKEISKLIIKTRFKKAIFSNDMFYDEFNSKKYLFNFVLFGFKKNFKKKHKIFDFVFYYKKNSNKGNNFYIELINELSIDKSIAIIGDKVKKKFKNNKNIHNFVSLSRKKSLNIISKSKFGLASKENVLSFFTLDCISNQLVVFYNNDLKVSKLINTNQLCGIDLSSIKHSIKIIKKESKKIKFKKYFEFKKIDYLKYLSL